MAFFWLVDSKCSAHGYLAACAWVEHCGSGEAALLDRKDLFLINFI